MTLARTERAALAGLLDRLGPDRPTLCEGWTTGDLLIHLLTRERRPDARLAALIPPLSGWFRRVAAGYAALSWRERVQLIRGGPSRWNPMSLGPVDSLVNGMEYFIHHEDARRGEPGWEPRQLDPATAAAVADLARSLPVRAMLHRAGVGVTAAFPGDDPVVLRRGSPMAVLTGEPAEVVLWASGRNAVRLDIGGDDKAVEKLRAAGRIP